jgi:hypothetical protein
MLSHKEAQELHQLIGTMHLQVSNKAATDITEDETERALELAALLVSDTMGGRDSDPSPVSHNPCLQGKVLIDGAESEFLIPLDNDSVGFSQWGAPTEVLWQRVELLDNLSGPAREWYAENREESTDE